MKKRPRLFLILIGVGVLVGVIAVVFRPAPEPEYGGKRLSEWVDRIGSTTTGVKLRRFGRDATAEDAIAHIGSNGVPFLLMWIQYEPSKWKINLYGFAHEKLHWHLVDKMEQRADGASTAFGILGREAVASIPELNRQMMDPTASGNPVRAANALAGLGDAGLQPLLVLMTNRPNLRWPGPRTYAVYLMGRLGTNAQAVRPALLSLLSDPDPAIAKAATIALRQIDPETLEKATAQ